ncbi:HlyD family type I secretion periplasmic adaptor subunit [Bosea sp. TND4EK4]|uniref:HlyD family type I secretion periplasmic adaptor subunit n=1 Tax=Bosea sp. TND4EK4 TaxID=1907408 RepID=UPI00095420E2|nr:HlyD family type I secretion periplasmic adaptor subunit [Bosea sp. TND4EK4]SIP88749.1 HlyD family secretion protein [Bosea sp. TND4EK4]
MAEQILIRPWYADIPREPRLAKVAGVAIMASVLLGFGVWGNTAPIAGAVIANGLFVTTGQNKTIQHLEGGVIREILVREGDIVEPGQLLVQLDDVAARAELRRLQLRLYRAETIEARLNAEVQGEEGWSVPSHLSDRARDPEFAGLLRTQTGTFVAHQRSMQNEVIVHRKAIDGLNEKLTGSQAQLGSVQKQLQLIREELAGKTALLERGYIRKPEVLALQRNAANLEGELGRITGDIGDAKERIAREMELIDGVKRQVVKTASEQLQDIAAELNDVRERLRTARGVAERTRIVAPVKGSVVKLRYHTSGGVIEAGKNVMDIVPLQDEIIIEAKVRPQDIDKIKHSQLAVVRLTALNQRTTPMIDGRIIYISADALPDEKQRGLPNGTDLYVVRVRLDSHVIEHVPHFEPTPGMPAEVFIKTSERTFFQYLIQPLKDSMSRAFRET